MKQPERQSRQTGRSHYQKQSMRISLIAASIALALASTAAWGSPPVQAVPESPPPTIAPRELVIHDQLFHTTVDTTWEKAPGPVSWKEITAPNNSPPAEKIFTLVTSNTKTSASTTANAINNTGPPAMNLGGEYRVDLIGISIGHNSGGIPSAG